MKSIGVDASNNRFIGIGLINGNTASNIGVSPSGKATDSDSVIREFKSLHPSHFRRFLAGIRLKTVFLLKNYPMMKYNLIIFWE